MATRKLPKGIDLSLGTPTQILYISSCEDFKDMSHFYHITHIYKGYYLVVVFFCTHDKPSYEGTKCRFWKTLSKQTTVVLLGIDGQWCFSAGLPNNDSPFNYFLRGTLNFNILVMIKIRNTELFQPKYISLL